jgi:hypothetical protein
LGYWQKYKHTHKHTHTHIHCAEEFLYLDSWKLQEIYSKMNTEDKKIKPTMSEVSRYRIQKFRKRRICRCENI